MTPYELNLLLHIYTSPAPHESHNLSLYNETLRDFVRLGVVIADKSTMHSNQYVMNVTALGEAWIKTILNTPLPEPCYVDYMGNIIEEDK